MISDRCYIIGGGPSLEKLTYLEVLDMKKNFVIGCNWAYKILFDELDVLVFLDDVVEEFLLKEKKRTFDLFTIYQNYQDYILVEGFGFEKGRVAKCGASAGYAALSLALHMDFKEIFLYGFDVSDMNGITGFSHDHFDKNVTEQRKLFELNELISHVGDNTQVYNVRGHRKLKALRLDMQINLRLKNLLWEKK